MSWSVHVTGYEVIHILLFAARSSQRLGDATLFRTGAGSSEDTERVMYWVRGLDAHSHDKEEEAS